MWRSPSACVEPVGLGHVHRAGDPPADVRPTRRCDRTIGRDVRERVLLYVSRSWMLCYVQELLQQLQDVLPWHLLPVECTVRMLW